MKYRIIGCHNGSTDIYFIQERSWFSKWRVRNMQYGQLSSAISDAKEFKNPTKKIKIFTHGAEREARVIKF